MKKTIYDWLGFISKESFYGIPLDIIAHIIMSVLLYALLRLILTPKTTFWTILIIAIGKEVHDLQVMTNTLVENIKDITVTLVMPLFFLYLHNKKNKKDFKRSKKRP